MEDDKEFAVLRFHAGAPYEVSRLVNELLMKLFLFLFCCCQIYVNFKELFTPDLNY